MSDKKVTAWSAALSAAPRDRQILMRHPGWVCPAVVHWYFNDEWQGWVFSKPVLSDIAASVHDDELTACEWALLPE